MIIDEAHEPEIEEENYFISMTDMMVGLIFIFIILLMYYALQFRQVTDQLSGAEQTRTEILKKIQTTLKDQGVIVTIDEQNGVMHLPESILFASGKAELSEAGESAVNKLSDALESVLPCYANGGNHLRVSCPKVSHRIESLYVEGHTDNVPLSGSGRDRDNWDLSVSRATNTYRQLTRRQTDLEKLCAINGGKCEPILSVSGYGENRPIDAIDKSRNRRIDVRIIMMTPDASEVDRISNEVSTHR